MGCGRISSKGVKKDQEKKKKSKKMQGLGCCQEREEAMWSSQSIRTKLLGLLSHCALGDHFPRPPPPAHSCSTHLDFFPGPLRYWLAIFPRQSTALFRAGIFSPCFLTIKFHSSHETRFTFFNVSSSPLSLAPTGPCAQPYAVWVGTCWRTE